MKIKGRTNYNRARVKRYVQQKNFRSFEHAGASIRLIARRSIRKSKKYAPPGKPARTRGNNKGLKNALAFEATEKGVVIGFRKSIIGTSATPHEHGGRYRGAYYDKRPILAPALAKAMKRLPDSWRISK